MDGGKDERGTAGAGSAGLDVLSRTVLDVSGDVHRLVTFLNRSLKDEGFIFGLRVAEGHRYQLTIYREGGAQTGVASRSAGAGGPRLRSHTNRPDPHTN